MKNKKKGAGKPAPKGDTTQKRRQSRRREKLNEIAKMYLFSSWSAYETAVINGVARLTQRALDFAICAPEYHALLDEAGDRFCRMCGQPLSQ